jgi:selenium metabolism protein YedF
METLDMRGKPCPLPVVNAKKELEKQGAACVVVLVDNELAVQNLRKMADGKGYIFSYIQQGENIEVTISKEGNGTAPMSKAGPADKADKAATEGAVVLISADSMGRGCSSSPNSEELGQILIKGFIFSLTELPKLPKAVIFINSGVKLAAAGSNTVADLQALSAKGTVILACGTCLNYYGLTELLAVGEVADMYSITGYLASAEKLITI